MPQNVLTPLEPNEIAALMSSMVCQEKRCSEPDLNDVLLKGELAMTDSGAETILWLHLSS